MGQGRANVPRIDAKGEHDYRDGSLNIRRGDGAYRRRSGAASCRETGVFRDLHGAYAKSGDPRCIGGGG